jgi:hypothetical protein
MVSAHRAFSPEGTPGALRVAAVRARTAESSAKKQPGQEGQSSSRDDDMALETMVRRHKSMMMI